MKILLSWVNDFVKIDDIDLNELVQTMTVSGFEVEEVIDLSKSLNNIISVKLLKVTKHPNADNLSICIVDTGNGKTLQIITRATNMKEGDILCLALDGAVLCDGTAIKSNMMRGEKSEGMFCGFEEIGIDNSIYPNCENDGLFILKSTEKIGVPISEILNMNEVILDVSVLPNRPDCNSIIGLAREIAAMFGRDFKMPKLTYNTTQIDKKISVKVENRINCPRYMGTVISNIKNGDSPAWMQRRLKLLNHTPHSLLVDITNYVLLEMGQPLHAFDFSKINGQTIVVRDAHEEEKIIALDEKEYILNAKNLVIADNKRALVIAGVMGGLESGTFANTQDVFLESAVFDYANIRRTSNYLGLSSDSSIRYSKGVFFASAENGIKRALSLIDDLHAGTISNEIVDVFDDRPKKKIIESNPITINQRASLNLTGEEMVDILNSLQIKSVFENGKIISIVPEFRTDLEQECDICEEIARIYGIDNIIMSDIIPTFTTIGEVTTQQKRINLLKEACVGEGFAEMVNYRYTSPNAVLKINQNPSDYIQIINPIGRDYSLIRKNLLVNALGVITNNQKVKNENLKFFELSAVFIPKQLPLTELPDEKQHLLLITNSDVEDFYSIKSSLNEIVSAFGVEFDYKQSKNEFMHPGKTADVLLYNRVVGYIGELHPTVSENFKIKGKTIVAEIDLTDTLQRDPSAKKGLEPSKLATICRDLAFVVDSDFPAGQIVSTIKKHFKNEIENISIFDIYEGSQLDKGFKSVAIKFYIKQNDKTLTDLEINEIMNKIIKFEKKENNAKLR